LAEEDRCLNVMPLFHIHGIVGALLSSVIASASVICTPGFDAEKFLPWLETLAPTWYTAVPTMHHAVLSRARSNPELVKGHALRFIRSSSSAMPVRVLQELEERFRVPVIEAYGMTEAAHQMTSNPLPAGQRKLGSVGMAAGPEVSITDELGNVLSPGKVGEIVIRGANLMSGYLNNPESADENFETGWFRTGDQGYLDTDGYLFITGRLKEMINRGGEKIAPREVEDLWQRVHKFVAPQTQAEKTLAAIWSQVLGIERIGAQDNFFALGGDSLRATLVISRVRQAFHIEFPLRSLFEMQTVKQLAMAITEIQGGTHPGALADMLPDIESLGARK
jgi:acyl-CoA synthetase (AMP-forming)/AMP-acid ligase II